jgi:hypothetical protein
MITGLSSMLQPILNPPLRVAWISALVIWIVLYLRIQLERINIFDRDSFQKMKKSVLKEKEQHKGILLYFGMLWWSMCLYPIRSIVIWVCLTWVTFVIF